MSSRSARLPQPSRPQASVTWSRGTAAILPAVDHRRVPRRLPARAARVQAGQAFPIVQPLPVDYAALVDALKTFEPRAPDITAAEAEDQVLGTETILITTKVEPDGSD